MTTQTSSGKLWKNCTKAARAKRHVCEVCCETSTSDLWTNWGNDCTSTQVLTGEYDWSSGSLLPNHWNNKPCASTQLSECWLRVKLCRVQKWIRSADLVLIINTQCSIKNKIPCSRIDQSLAESPNLVYSPDRGVTLYPPSLSKIGHSQCCPNLVFSSTFRVVTDTGQLPIGWRLHQQPETNFGCTHCDLSRNQCNLGPGNDKGTRNVQKVMLIDPSDFYPKVDQRGPSLQRRMCFKHPGCIWFSVHPLLHDQCFSTFAVVLWGSTNIIIPH